MIKFLRWYPVNAPNPPARPPITDVINTKSQLFGREKIPATLSVRIESVCISIIDASNSQRIPIPRNPLTKEDNPFVEMIKFMSKLATTTDHHGAGVIWNRYASRAIKTIFIRTLKLVINSNLKFEKKLFGNLIHPGLLKIAGHNNLHLPMLLPYCRSIYFRDFPIVLPGNAPRP